MIVDLAQGSLEWLKYRQKKLGASESPIVMRKQLDWGTPYSLWLRKRTPIIDGEFKQESNWAIERGNRLEPKVRAKYELETGLSFPAVTLVHPELDWLMASLDGLNEETSEKIVLEIKVPNKEVFELAKAGQVHEKYIYQLEHQLEVAKADVVHFVCGRVEKIGYNEVIVEIAVAHYRSNPALKEEWLSEVTKFWRRVETGEAPEYVAEDAVTMRDSRGIELFKSIGKRLVELDKLEGTYSQIESELESLKEQVSGLITHPIMKYRGVISRRKTLKGMIDWKKLDADFGEKLDPYRKEAKEVLRFELKK